MRMSVIRVVVVSLVAGLMLAWAVVALTEPAAVVNYSHPVPDVPCLAGVSPFESFCYVTAPPGSSRMPDTNVPPPSFAP